jgi:hypothetical protein
MFRKLTVLICLLSFCPAAFGAQDIVGISNAPLAVEQQSQQKPLNLNPSASAYAVEKGTAADSMKCSDIVKAEAPKKVSSDLTFSDWAEVHFGGSRWMWWAGGAVVLGALHAFVFSN